jgi:hypothetical protein
MKNILRLLIFAIFLSAAPLLLGQDQAAAPEIKQGDFWVFQVTEKDFSAQSTQALGGEYEVFYTKEKFLVRRPGGTETVPNTAEIKRMIPFDDERHYLQFPLAVGKKWSAHYEVQLRGASKEAERTAETTVSGMEEIVTPAGKFRAFKIERYDTGGGGRKGGTGNFVYTYYYSPETRSVVKYHYEAENKSSGMVGSKRDIELIKFGSRTPKP